MASLGNALETATAMYDKDAWDETPSVPWAVAVDDDLGGPGGASCLLASLYLLVCVCGLAGNGLVVAAVVKADRVSSSTSVYVLALALADGLFMLGLPLAATQTLLRQWPFGDAACRLLTVLDGMNQFTSAFCLTAMSLDRFLALSNPLRFAAWRSPRRALAVVLLLWPLSLAPVLPVAAHFSARGGVCAADAELAEGGRALLFLVSAFTLGLLLPMATMLGSFGALAWRRRRRFRNHCAEGGVSEVVATETERAERQVTAMVAAVAVAFGVCWTPFYVLNFLSLWLGEQAMAFIHVFEASVVLSYGWSCANPLLYALLSPAFRRHFAALLCPHKSPSRALREPHTERYDLSDGPATA